MAIADMSGAEDGERPVLRLESLLRPSAAVTSAEEPESDPSLGSVADVPGSASAAAEAPLFTPADPVVMNTGVFGTVTPALSAPAERSPNSARALDSERDACALLGNVFGAGGGVADSDWAAFEDGDCDELDRGDAVVCAARSAWSRKYQQRLLVPGSMR